MTVIPWDGTNPAVEKIGISNLAGDLTVVFVRWSPAHLLGILWVFIIIGMMLIGIRKLPRIVQVSREGRPFAPENVGRIRWVGCLVILEALFNSAITSLVPWFCSDYVEFSGLTIIAGESMFCVHLPFRVDYSILLVGGLTLLLAEMFRVGSELERSRERARV